MNNGDKVGTSTVGEILCKKKTSFINPFPKGNNLVYKAHKLVTYCSYGTTRYEQLWSLANAFSGFRGEWVNINLDLNGTQISARKSLLYSMGRNIIGLKSYTMHGNTHGIDE